MNSNIQEEIKATQSQLLYRNKIIKLQNQVSYENNRANQYQILFKKAVIQKSSQKPEQQILQKLAQKQLEVITLKKQLIQITKKISDNTLQVNLQDLIKQNIQLRNIIQQLKNTAIETVLQKNQQIQILTQKYLELQKSTQTLEQKNQQLQQTIQQKNHQHLEELDKLNNNISNQRINYINNLNLIQNQINQEKQLKQHILIKSESLQGNLQEMRKTISNYQKQLIQISNTRSTDKIISTKIQSQLKQRIQQLLIDLKQIQKKQITSKQNIANYKIIIYQQQKQIDTLKQQKQQLSRKLKIKVRKNNQCNKNIYQSFQQFSNKANLYSSFTHNQQQNPQSSFIQTPTKLSDVKQISTDQISGFSNYILNDLQQNDEQTNQTTNASVIKKPQPQLSKQKIDKIIQYQQQIKIYLEQIQNCNNVINKLTKQIQIERQNKYQVKQKYLTKQSQYQIQQKNLKMHINKLQNALLTQKLTNALNLQTEKQIKQKQIKMYQNQIKSLIRQHQLRSSGRSSSDYQSFVG